MSRTTIRSKKTRSEISALVKAIPRIISGKEPDRHGIRKVFVAHWAYTFFKHLHKAFNAKSRGRQDTFGTSWRPLNVAYARWKRKKLGHARILVFKGTLEESLKPGRIEGNTYRPSRNQIFRTNKGGIEVGTKVPYAIFHHRGTRRIPKRPLWPSTDQMKDWYKAANAAATKAVADHLRKILA